MISNEIMDKREEIKNLHKKNLRNELRFDKKQKGKVIVPIFRFSRLRPLLTVLRQHLFVIKKRHRKK